MGRLRMAKTSLFDVADQDRSPVRDVSGILVGVHAGSSKADGLPILISFGCRPREQPAKRSQLEALANFTGPCLDARCGEFELKRFRKLLFDALFGGGRAARTFDLGLLVAILASVSVVMADSVGDIGPRWSDRLRMAEIAFTAIFSLEYLLRLFCHPRPSRYATGFFGLVDFVSIVPTWLEFVVPGLDTLAALRVLRMFRIFRILSLGRFSRASMTIGNALEATRYKIGAFVIGVVLVSVVAGSLMFLVEGPENGFTSIPASTYWAIITMTTVGHGSLLPSTVLGQILTSVLVVIGYAVVAIPVGVITSEVLAAKNAREELLSGDETDRQEFKSSAFYSYANPDIPQKVIFEASVLKPVAGFLNARGGFLFIGVDDSATPIGIQPDLETRRWNTEQYVRHLTDRIGEEFGSAAATCTRIRIEMIKGLEVCVVEIDPSPDPVWLVKAEKSGKRKVFYVRVSNSTRELDGPEFISYFRKRWD